MREPNTGYYKIDYNIRMNKALQKVFDIRFPNHTYQLVIDLVRDPAVSYLEVTPALNKSQLTLLVLLVAEVEMEWNEVYIQRIYKEVQCSQCTSST